MYTLYNQTARDLDDEYQALKTIKDKAYQSGFDAGRAAGFAAGYAAAQGQPQAKIEAAYEQGKADAAKLVPVSRPLLRKNGVGY